MNDWFKKAEEKVQSTEKCLQRLLHDDDDISCFNPSALDEAIADLVKARSYMMIGRYEDTPAGDDILL